MNAESSSQQQTSRFPSKLITVVGTVLSACWAFITYMFPDPSTLDWFFFSWEGFIYFCAACFLMIAFFIAFITRKLHRYIKSTISIILALALALSFFVLGKEYAKPSLGFTDQNIIENNTPVFTGARVEMIEALRVQLVSCNIIAQTPSCTLELTSTNSDREIGFTSNTTFFEPNGGSLKLEKIFIGNKESRRTYGIELARGLPTRITLVFQSTQNDIDHIPSVKLVVQGLENRNQVIKFNDLKSG
ncbi:hypothetical protein ACUN8C_14545 [Kushneria sp. Sum13]|uniref:hypothetical protein n=1 Tax=Kushneria sp. Sum13 TaxID=3459196 RepID=UPI004045458D